MYFRTYLQTQTTSSAAILNSPIDLFCPLDTALVLTSDDTHSIFPIPSTPPLFLFLPGGFYSKLSCDAIFTVCLHTFMLLWLRKTSISVETYQLSFHVFICALIRVLLIFSVRFSPFYPYVSVTFLSNVYPIYFKRQRILYSRSNPLKHFNINMLSNFSPTCKQ